MWSRNEVRIAPGVSCPGEDSGSCILKRFQEYSSGLASRCSLLLARRIAGQRRNNPEPQMSLEWSFTAISGERYNRFSILWVFVGSPCHYSWWDMDISSYVTMDTSPCM